MLTIQEALQNIDIVVSNTKMTSPEHDALKESILLVAQRCKQADELEKIISEQKKEKDPEEPVPDFPSDSKEVK